MNPSWPAGECSPYTFQFVKYPLLNIDYVLSGVSREGRMKITGMLD